MQKGAKIVAGFLVAGLGMVTLTGCGADEIRVYKAPKPQPPLAAADSQQLPPDHPPIPGATGADQPQDHPHDHEQQRLLGAITTHGQRTWFFKLIGPIEAVSNHADAFADFIQSLQFPAEGNEPLQWKLPDGWRQLPASGMRFATLQIVAGPSPLEVAIFALGGEAGGMLSNINLWRAQVELPPIAESDLPKETRIVNQGGHKITLVELIGHAPGKLVPHPAQPASAGGSAVTGPARPAPPPLLAKPDAPPSAPEAAPTQPTSAGRTSPVTGETDTGDVKLTYDTPQGWQTLPPSSPRLLSFSAGDTQVAVTKFPGDVGGMLLNVNRWRSQVGLPDIKADGLKDAVQPIDVGPLKGSLVELYGPDAGGDKRPGLLVVSVQREGVTWFFKMAGPAGAVQQRKTSFQGWVKSVKFAPSGASDAK